MTIGRRLAALLERSHRHHESRRAESTLGAVVFQKRLLHRMQFATLIGQSLDREHGGAVKLRQQQQAGVDRIINRPPVFQPANNDRAGAAVALRAPFLGADHAFAFAKILQDGHGGRYLGNATHGAVEEELNNAGHAEIMAQWAATGQQFSRDAFSWLSPNFSGPSKLPPAVSPQFARRPA